MVNDYLQPPKVTRKTEIGDHSVRQAAAQSLSEVKQPASALVATPPHTQRSRRQNRRAPRRTRAALAAQADGDAAERREAVAVRGYLKQPDALPARTALISRDPGAEVRRAAVGAAGYGAGADTAAALLHALRDPVWQVREEAATTLGKLTRARDGAHAGGLSEVGGALTAALDDSYWQIRLRAARSLGRLRYAGALPALRPVAADPDPEVRKAARLALEQIAAARST